MSYLAAFEGAVLLDRSSRGKLEISGADRASYLQGLLTNDIVALRPGAGCYAAYLTPQGRMISDMRVTELGQLLLMDLPEVTTSKVRQALEDLVFAEDVQIVDRTSSLSLFGIHGPRSVSILTSVLNASASGLNDLPEHFNLAVPWEAGTVHVVGARYLGLIGFDLYVDRERQSSVSRLIQERGAVPLTAEAAEILRVEAGIPSFPEDMSVDTLPLEAGIEDRAISHTKGCYVGQEIIVRVLHRGHGRVARKLVGLRVDDGGVPPSGARLFEGDREVGAVTSAVFSPAIGAPLALAYLRRDRAEAGTKVAVERGTARMTATVIRPPRALEVHSREDR